MKSVFKATNVRPSNWNPHDNNLGDCTTRAMTYCLGGEMSYDEIEAEQYAIGNRMGKVRNAVGVWDKVLTNRGYGWIQLDRVYVRHYIAETLGGFENAMVTISSGHACAIHRGEVIDTWDSRGGRVYGLLVKTDDIDEVLVRLQLNGINAEPTQKPTKPKKRKVVRRIFRVY